MNREILFRGKRDDTGEWMEGYFGQSVDTFIIQDYGLVAGHFKVFKVIPETVGQYTGLTDKNGRKIFEGDIIADKNELFSVRWSEKISGFVAVGEHRMQPSMNQGTMKYCEVVGNIYDNDESMQNTEPPTQADSWLMSRFQKQE